MLHDRERAAIDALWTVKISQDARDLLADAGTVLDRHPDLQFVLIDCEKDDYIRFFDALRLAPGAVVVADNILSHALWDYVGHVRAVPGVQSLTLPVGKGLEVSRVGLPPRVGG